MTISVELVNAMYEHSQWSNHQLLKAAEELSNDELNRPVPGAYGSVLAILVHMMGAQKGWTLRFNELDPVQPPDPADYAGIPELRVVWAAIDAETNACIDTLNDDVLGQVIKYRSWHGWEGESPRWQAVLHQAFHQHQHRGEVAGALTAFGHSPGELDIFDYLEDPTYQERPRA